MERDSNGAPLLIDVTGLLPLPSGGDNVPIKVAIAQSPGIAKIPTAALAESSTTTYPISGYPTITEDVYNQILGNTTVSGNAAKLAAADTFIYTVDSAGTGFTAITDTATGRSRDWRVVQHRLDHCKFCAAGVSHGGFNRLRHDDENQCYCPAHL